MKIKKQKSIKNLRRLCALCALCGFSFNSAHAQTQPAETPAPKPTIILVVAAEGEEEFGEAFTKAAEQWQAAAKTAKANLITIGLDPAPPTPATATATAPTTAPTTAPAPLIPGTDKFLLKQAIDAQSPESNQQLWLVFIGHGTSDTRESKINLRGPDVADVELNTWFKNYRRPLAIVVCTSSSGPFLGRLSAPSRIVITATRAGAEFNYSRFGEYFAGSVADRAADLDKDGQTSLLEAFLAASNRTAEFYKTESRMLTEHALLDDNGDGLGVSGNWFKGIRATRSARTGAPIDGARAHQWHLVMTATESALTLEARARRDELELQIESLRTRKPNMTEDSYYAALEQLMLDLGKLYHATPQPARPGN